MRSRIELRRIAPRHPQPKQLKEQRALLLYLFEVSDAGCCQVGRLQPAPALSTAPMLTPYYEYLTFDGCSILLIGSLCRGNARLRQPARRLK
jgi:hypothetical protein